MAAGIGQILVGVDFSNYSKTVLKEARGLASSLGVPLVLVHVFVDPIESDWQEGIVRAEINRRIKEKMISFYKLTNEELIVKRGKAHKQLLAAAKTLKNPLIVIGYRGFSGALERMFLGNTAERLALHTTFPLIIYRGKSLSRVKSVLIPADLSDRALRSLKSVKALGFKKLRFELLHIMTPPPPIFEYDDWSMIYGDYKETLAKNIMNFKKKVAPLKVNAYMANNVVNEISKQSKKFDLIAISPSPNKDFLSNLGSVTAKVIRTGRTSVLVAP